MDRDKIKFLVVGLLFFISLLAATLYRKSDFRFAYKNENANKLADFDSEKYLKYLDKINEYTYNFINHERPKL
jgi:hypothetical protein